MYGKTERLEWNEKQYLNADNHGINYLRGTEEIKKEYDKVREILGEKL